MSTSKVNLIPSLEHRDLRSAAVPSKRDKDHEEKWSHNNRSAVKGEKLDVDDDLINGTEKSSVKLRPGKIRVSTAKSKKLAKAGWSATKTHGRNTSKSSVNNDFPEDATSQLSRSLLELLPQHENNHRSAICTTTAECIESKLPRSSDRNDPFAAKKGHTIHLEELVDQAEKTWEGKMIERIVEGEYEVLDEQGEKTVLSRRGRKNSKPKFSDRKAETPSILPDEDDGFELI